MKKNQFEILQIRELPSSIVRDGEVSKEDVAASRLSYLIVFQHQEGNEAVAVHVSLRYQTEKTVLLQEGATLIAKIDGWDEMSKDDESLKKDERILAFIDYSLAFVGGMVFRHVAGTALNSIAAPQIMAVNIMDNVVINALPKQTGKE
ncbi:MAG: hypothetical protein IJ607_11000 [Bacteroidaceae bacterium]|nr:hypothetical protein [Bacteroidaceae bacterium]